MRVTVRRWRVGAGVPVDLTDVSGNMLRMLAAYHGHPDAVTMLSGLGLFD